MAEEIQVSINLGPESYFAFNDLYTMPRTTKDQKIIDNFANKVATTYHTFINLVELYQNHTNIQTTTGNNSKHTKSTFLGHPECFQCTPRVYPEYIINEKCPKTDECNDSSRRSTDAEDHYQF